MRSAAHMIISFPVPIAESRSTTMPGVVVGPLPRIDPRRLSADIVTRTRRAPPPIEDDTVETFIWLGFVIAFLAFVW